MLAVSHTFKLFLQNFETFPTTSCPIKANIYPCQKICFRQNQVTLRDDALDREATLMNVLKSVTANRSEIDLTEAGKDSNPDQRKSSGFSFFGMRSKSKENVIDTNPAEDNTEEVKKLPTTDQNKKEQINLKAFGEFLIIFPVKIYKCRKKM